MRYRLLGHRADLSGVELQADASAIGLNVERFAACVAARKHRTAIRDDVETAFRLGVRDAPTFFVGRVQANGVIELTRRLSGALPIGALQEAVSQVSEE